VSQFLLIFCGIFGVKHGKIWTKTAAFGPRILPGFSGRCPGTRKISEKKPQKYLTFACTCGIISVTVEMVSTAKQKGWLMIEFLTAEFPLEWRKLDPETFWRKVTPLLRIYIRNGRTRPIPSHAKWTPIHVDLHDNMVVVVADMETETGDQ